MSEMIVIDDSNYQNFISPIVDGQKVCKGYFGMWETAEAKELAKPFSELGIPLLPETEWDARIDQLERDRSTLKDFCLDSGLTVLSQGQTNYCWVNAPTFCCMILRLQETGRPVRLSPASAGSVIKQFSNQGGWGSQALAYFIKAGLNEQADWPANAIDRKFYTEVNKEKAKKNIALEHYKLEGFQETASCILAGIPVAIGLNWWSHEITGVGIIKGSHDLVIANSWGASWSDQGYGILKGSKKNPDDACAITSMVAA